jgi:ElaB/YqjD/DUF883 family membrane-anchored ribosome-binding protein
MTRDADRQQSTDEIRADIERTRERLGETVEALGAQLNPSLLKQRVKDSVREATIGRVKTMASNAREKAGESGRGLVSTLRDNPIPAALIAGGIGWLLFNKRRGGTETRAVEDYDYRSELRASYGGAGVDFSEETIDYTRQIPEPPAEGVAERVTATARDATERVASTARAATDRVASSASNAAHVVADRARAGTQRVEQTFDQNPMVLGVVAAAVGLAVGMTLPATDKESELVGGKRDQLVDKAREALADTKDKVRNVAERAVPEIGATLKAVARDEGLAH